MASFNKSREENPISNSLQEALIFLNRQTIEEGKIYSRRYFTDSSKSSVDIVLAVGVLPGVGPNCYSIISHTKKTVVYGVSEKLPDVSEVTLGRLFVYWDSNSGRSYLVYLLSGSRIVEPVSFPLIVHNIEDSHLYYIAEHTIVDIYEHLGGIFDMEEKINSLEQQIKDLKKEIENNNTTNTTTTPAPEPEEPTTTTTTPAPVVNLVINSFKCSDGEEYELGEIINPRLTWSYNIPISSQKINGVEIDAALREVTYTGISSDTTYTLEAKAGSSTKTKSTSLKFSAMSYIGSSEIVEIDEITSDTFMTIFSELDMKEEGLSNVFCKGSITKTFTFTSRSSLFLAFPSEIASKLVIIDSSINSPVNCTKKNITVENSHGTEINYTIYESPSVYAPGTTLKWIFNFN